MVPQAVEIDLQEWWEYGGVRLKNKTLDRSLAAS